MKTGLFLLLMTALPLKAGSSDDEIIKNLEFFQNIEVLRNDNPYILITESTSDQDKSDISLKNPVTEKKK